MKLFWIKEGDLLAAYDQHDGFLRGIVMKEIGHHVSWVAAIGVPGVDIQQGVSVSIPEAKRIVSAILRNSR